VGDEGGSGSGGPRRPAGLDLQVAPVRVGGLVH
jgi:hypothetical protein